LAIAATIARCRRDAAFENGRFARGGPAPGVERLARKIDDRIRAVDS
jgi:hypothetical protein